jgi:hypothetical protein
MGFISLRDALVQNNENNPMQSRRDRALRCRSPLNRVAFS